MRRHRFRFSETSRARLATCHSELWEIMMTALAFGFIDMTIVSGKRGREEQNKAYEEGKSKKQFPDSKHNFSPSLAVDVAPYVNGKISDKIQDYTYMAGIIMAVAAYKGINLRWGGNWDGDGVIIQDQDFNDLAHFEVLP